MKKIKFSNYFNSWSLFEKLWLSIATVLIIALSIFWKDNLIGIITSLTGVWCVILVAKGKILNYYVGIINVILYAYISFGWAYYGEVMLNLGYYLPLQFVGIVFWKNNLNKNKTEVIAKRMSTKSIIFWSIVCSAAILAYGYILKALGGSLPFFDSTSTVLSVIAMIFMILRYLEQWVLWIIVNIVSIILWWYTMLQGGTDISILLMWVAYLFNAIWGLVNWVKMYKKENQIDNV